MINIKHRLAPYKKALSICQLITESGGVVRFIGGFVRDILSNKEVKDIDLATNLLPDEVQAILIKHNIQYFTIGKEFGTITAVIDNQPIEITTLRKDLSCDGRHAKVEFTNSWKDDAQRRDFTINALSIDLDGNIYDYFNGIEDLKQKKIRFIGKAEERINEDYLRILRFFRFSSYIATQLDEEGLQACNKNAYNLQKISSERKKTELTKIFNSPNAKITIPLMEHIFLAIFPLQNFELNKLNRLYAIIEKFNYKSIDLLCFGVLLNFCLNKNDIIKNFSFSRIEQKFLTQTIKADIKKWDYDSLKSYRQAYKNNFKELLLVKFSLSNESLENYVLTTNLEKLFSETIKPLPIKGEDLLKLGIAPGKDMGKLLIIADQIWNDHNFNITKEELLRDILLHASKI